MTPEKKSGEKEMIREMIRKSKEKALTEEIKRLREYVPEEILELSKKSNGVVKRKWRK